MSQIDKNRLGELKKKVGFDDIGEHRIKKVNLVNDSSQIRIRIPKKFVELLKIDQKKDYFEFHMIPEEDGSYSLEGKLIKE